MGYDDYYNIEGEFEEKLMSRKKCAWSVYVLALYNNLMEEIVFVRYNNLEMPTKTMLLKTYETVKDYYFLTKLMSTDDFLEGTARAILQICRHEKVWGDIQYNYILYFLKNKFISGLKN